MQAALGVSQLKKLPEFIKRRKENFVYLYNGLKSLEQFLILPEVEKNADPSWFGFPITLKANVKITRNQMTQYLEKNKIGTRMLFGGNILHQPMYKNINKRIVGQLENSDIVMNKTFWIGLYPELHKIHFDYIIKKIHEALNEQ